MVFPRFLLIGCLPNLGVDAIQVIAGASGQEEKPLSRSPSNRSLDTLDARFETSSDASQVTLRPVGSSSPQGQIGAAAYVTPVPHSDGHGMYGANSSPIAQTNFCIPSFARFTVASLQKHDSMMTYHVNLS